MEMYAAVDGNDTYVSPRPRPAPQIRRYLTPLEIMASLIAAVTHDLDHPGVNQPFLIATSNHLAALYEVRGAVYSK